jgi:predicted rRNA methylase YqxC with S4 and FtsJ domains
MLAGHGVNVGHDQIAKQLKKENKISTTPQSNMRKTKYDNFLTEPDPKAAVIAFERPADIAISYEDAQCVKKLR